MVGRGLRAILRRTRTADLVPAARDEEPFSKRGTARGDGNRYARRRNEQHDRSVYGKIGADEGASHGCRYEHFPHGRVGESEQRSAYDYFKESACDDGGTASREGPRRNGSNSQRASEDGNQAQRSEILRRKCCGKAGSGCNDKNAGNGNEERVRRKPSGGHFVKSEAPLAEKSGSDSAQERGREKPSCSFSRVIQWEVSSHSLSSGTCETWFVLYCCMVSQGAVARVAFGHWVI